MAPSQSSASAPPPSSSSIQKEPISAAVTISSPPTSIPLNPAEAKKIASLNSKIAALEAQLKEIAEKQNEVDRKLQTKDPQATVKAHIKLLHDYNEIRDIGQGLMGISADNRGVRVSDVYRDFDVGEGD